MKLFVLLPAVLFSIFPTIYAVYTCTATQKCASGCCRLEADGTGNCGLGPTFCGKGNCTSTCDQKAECDPGWGSQWSTAEACPLNVCCSEYGFCGTTSDFCGAKTVVSPSCGGSSSDARTIGYYEGWNLERECGTMTPEQIPLGYYTHINFAFALIDPKTFNIAPMGSDVAALYQRVTKLKVAQPGLQVWISVGGWSMNDPGPTTTTFSDLASSASAQSNFFNSLISFMQTNGFDGVDIDWEYPVASDRGGKDADLQNYPTFLQNLRKALDESGMPTRPGISITIPSSYWYMRGFDVVKIDPIIDFFNIMTYDIHGTWDSTDPAIGSVAQAHTNLTEIQQSLELLWRNHINPAKVNLGLGFYGRSFTMSNPSCLEAGCPFSGGGNPGVCTNTSGILSAVEIRQIVADGGATVTFDPVAAVKIITWDKNQWVSYDDAETMKLKVQYANDHCLGGTMAWALDMDDGGTIDALGSDLSRNKSLVYDPSLLDPNSNTTDLGTA
ncbi:chitinase [Xylogone sp. PMI_703]|nr:chitinase [Xylogone sp. PMI_703]